LTLPRRVFHCVVTSSRRLLSNVQCAFQWMGSVEFRQLSSSLSRVVAVACLFAAFYRFSSSY